MAATESELDMETTEINPLAHMLLKVEIFSNRGTAEYSTSPTPCDRERCLDKFRLHIYKIGH